jgi:hypothetical protein
VLLFFSATDLPLKPERRDQLHRDEADSFVFFDGVNRHDVPVLQGRDRASFLFEPPAPLCIRGQLGRHHLDRDLPAQPCVLGAIHRSHPALAELVDDAVVQQGLAGFEGHVGFSDTEGTLTSPSSLKRSVVGPTD